MATEDDELAVLADELQQRGEPLGELIATHLAVSRLPAGLKRSIVERRIAAILERNHDRLFGALAPYTECTARPDLRSPAFVVASWRNGFADEVVVQSSVGGPSVDAVYREVRSLPIAARVRTMRIESPIGSRLAAALVADPPPRLRALRLGYGATYRPSDEAVFDLASLVPLVQRLEALIVDHRAVCPPLESDTLRELGWVSQRPAAPLARSRLPALRVLRLNSGAIPVGFCALFPALEELEAYSTHLDGGFLEELLASPVMARLRRLTLPLLPEDVEAVMQRPERVAALESFRINVAWHPGMAELRERARAVLPSCVTF